MTHYSAPLDDVRFLLSHVTPLSKLASFDGLKTLDADVVFGVLEEAARFAEEVIAPTNRDGDVEGSRMVDGQVVTPDSFKTAYRQYVESGWGAAQHAEEFGGGGFPLLVTMPMKEFTTSANMSFSLGPMLTTGAVYALMHHGSEEQQQKYLPKMVTGEWSGTMNLTEPQAGSDVGAVTAKAVPDGNGTYRLTGQKIYITYGDHDLTENVIHLVLARLPDAPVGTKGLSLFLVPKVRVNDDGTLGERNDVHAVSLEHKMGIHASPTCVMMYGENGDGAYAELVGRENDGMREMFTMMNDARLAVGLEGVSIAERAYQQAVSYAKDRTQGRAVGAASGPSPIIDHADVRRMLLTQRAYIEAARALCYYNAYAIDIATHATDDDERNHAQFIADLLTPLSKAWSTDLGVELTSLAVQVHGGMGYVEETGVAQHYRDARIAPIYEGTNGIQAIDLVGRKIGMSQGQSVQRFFGELQAMVASLGESFAKEREELARGLDLTARTTTWMLSQRDTPNDMLAGATPYLRIVSTVVAGVFMAVGADKAQQLLDADDKDGFSAAFLAAKVNTARFYLAQLLPSVYGLEAQVTAGADQLFALSGDDLSL